MTKKLTPKENKFYRKYHIPGCGNLNSVKVNAIFINKHNHKLHEGEKFELAWIHEKYLTEAARSATDEEREMFGVKKDMVIDFVSIVGEFEMQIIYKHETDLQIKFYRDNLIVAVIVGPKYQCQICSQWYPKRNKKEICKNCEVKNGSM